MEINVGTVERLWRTPYAEIRAAVTIVVNSTQENWKSKIQYCVHPASEANIVWMT